MSKNTNLCDSSLVPSRSQTPGIPTQRCICFFFRFYLSKLWISSFSSILRLYLLRFIYRCCAKSHSAPSATYVRGTVPSWRSPPAACPWSPPGRKACRAPPPPPAAALSWRHRRIRSRTRCSMRPAYPVDVMAHETVVSSNWRWRWRWRRRRRRRKEVASHRGKQHRRAQQPESPGNSSTNKVALH